MTTWLPKKSFPTPYPCPHSPGSWLPTSFSFYMLFLLKPQSPMHVHQGLHSCTHLDHRLASGGLAKNGAESPLAFEVCRSTPKQAWCIQVYLWDSKAHILVFSGPSGGMCNNSSNLDGASWPGSSQPMIIYHNVMANKFVRTCSGHGTERPITLRHPVS